MKKIICIVFVLLAVYTGSAQKKVQKKVLFPEIENWLKDELGKSIKTTSQIEGNQLQLNTFFTPGSRIKLVGYIKDYDPGCGITTGMIYVHNHITDEEIPVVVEIYPDGRFKVDIPSDHPRMFSIDFGQKWVQVYGEPGVVTAVILEGEELTENSGDAWKELEQTQYRGVLGKLNKELTSVKILKPDQETFIENKNDLTTEPETYMDYDKFRQKGLQMWEDAKSVLEKDLSREKLLPETKELLRKQLEVMYAGFLLRFAYRKSTRERETAPGAPDEYFDFLSQLSWNDPSLMIFDDAFSEFINLFQFSSPLLRAESVADINFEDPFSRRLIQSWRMADKAMLEKLSIPSEVINEMVKLRGMDFILRNCESQEEADEVLVSMQEDLTTLFFREEAQRMYDVHFGGMTYELPEGRAGSLFREVIAPFKGKYLLVDFWGIFCGPCVYGIRTMKEDRDRLKGDKDIEFLFITSEEESPADRYDAFVKEQELEHTFFLSADDYRYMRELFGFNGIPRYILVGREGEILSDNYQGSLFLDKIRELTGRTDI